jgi:hypothetical protein
MRWVYHRAPRMNTPTVYDVTSGPLIVIGLLHTVYNSQPPVGTHLILNALACEQQFNPFHPIQRLNLINPFAG